MSQCLSLTGAQYSHLEQILRVGSAEVVTYSEALIISGLLVCCVCGWGHSWMSGLGEWFSNERLENRLLKMCYPFL